MASRKDSHRDTEAQREESERAKKSSSLCLGASVASPLLLSYQQSWVRDPAPLKIYLKARQIGFSFAETLAEVMECLERPGAHWLLLSRGERQALELARKAKEHCQSIGAVARLYENELVGAASGRPRVHPERLHREREGKALPYQKPVASHWSPSIAQHRLEFPNGSWMIALPANPDTARGYAANVLLDEFAFHRDARAIYAAVYPSITRGFKLRIGSTPFGESGMFYELWTGQNAFSKHKTDIFEAQQHGLELDVQKLREGCPDEDIWRQEYCCEFISDATSWIPWELIIAAQSVDANMDWPQSHGDTEKTESLSSSVPLRLGGNFFLGVDVARRRDLTVLYLVERLGDVLHTRAVQRLANASFAEQQAAIEALLVIPSAVEGSAFIRRCAIDSTGIGAMLAETLQQKFGSRVEAVHFTLGVKEDLAVRVKRLFEERRIRIPDDRELRSAIHAVRKYATAAGHFRFDAERTDHGHADEFWALALAAYAADAGPVAALGGRESEPDGRTLTRSWVGSRAAGPQEPIRRGGPYQTAGDAERDQGRFGFFGPRGVISSPREREAGKEL